MNTKEAAKMLDEIDYGDNEASHMEAEEILLDYLDETGARLVVDAFNAAKDRCDFWYA